MQKIVTILGLLAAFCAFAGCANKTADVVPVAAQEAPAPVPHDYKAEVGHAK